MVPTMTATEMTIKDSNAEKIARRVNFMTGFGPDTLFGLTAVFCVLLPGMWLALIFPRCGDLLVNKTMFDCQCHRFCATGNAELGE